MCELSIMYEESPLVVDQSPIHTLNHKKDVHILSWAFLLIFLAYGAAQNLETTINTEANLGTISLGILYSSFTFFSLFASSVVRLLGSKNAFRIHFRSSSLVSARADDVLLDQTECIGFKKVAGSSLLFVISTVYNTFRLVCNKFRLVVLDG